MQFWRESEFVVVDGMLRTGTCGPNALAMAESWAGQEYVGTAEIFSRMRAAGRCDAQNGASTINGLHAQALADGQRIAGYQPYGEPWPEYAAVVAAALAAGHVVVIELANGQALHDEIDGQGENAVGLQYHYILLCMRGVFRGQAGYWAADGDNFAVGDVLQFYTDRTLADARPCAALTIAAAAQLSTPPPAAPKEPSTMNLEQFAATMPVLGPVLKGPYAVAGKDGQMDGTQELLCQNGKLLQFPDGQIVGGVCGQQLLAAEAQIAALQTQLAAAQAAAPAISAADAAKIAAFDAFAAALKA